MREIKAAAAERDVILEESKTLLKRYLGGDSEVQTPENVPFQYVSLIMPMLVFNDPQVQVGSRKSRNEQVRAMHHGVNRWVSDTKLAQRLRPAAFNLAFSFAALKVSIEEQPGFDGHVTEFVPVRPNVEHISSRKFVIDTRCGEDPENARFWGESITKDIDDLKTWAEDSKTGWLKDEIDNLKPDGDDADARDGDHVSRNEVTYYELWVPEITLTGDDLPSYWEGDDPSPESGYHGTIYTIAQQNESFIREPRPFYGPPSGPYELLGIYPRGDHGKGGSPLPLSPLVASRQQIDDWNDVEGTVTAGIRSYKRIFVAANAEKLQSANHGDMVNADGFDKTQSEKVEVGGVTDEQLSNADRLRDRTDRQLAMSESMRGRPSSNTTATAESIAADNASARFAFFKSCFLEHVRRLLEKVAWYLWHTPEAVFPLGDDAAQEMYPQPDGMPDDLWKPQVWFYGGEASEGEHDPDQIGWHELELTIDPYSMEKTNEALQQQRAMQTMEMVISLVPVIQQSVTIGPDGMPVSIVKWDQLLEFVGEAINRQGLGDFIDMQAILGMALQAAAPLAQPGAVANQSASNSPAQAGARMNTQARVAPYQVA